MDELLDLLREFNQRDDTNLDDLIALVERFGQGATPDPTDDAPHPLREWANDDPMSDEELGAIIAGLTALADDEEASAALLGEAADAVVSVQAEVQAREEVAAAEEAERQAAIARLRGEATDDEPEDDDDSGESDETSAEASEAADATENGDSGEGESSETASEPEPVTAAGSNRQARRAARRSLARRRPASAAPVETRSAPRIVFGIDVPGFGHGDEGTFTDVNRALAARFKQFRHQKGRGTEQFYPVATVQRDFPEHRTLTDASGRMLSPDHAAERVNAVVAAAVENARQGGALVAAGGLCAPLQPIYNVPTLGEQSRPIRDTALVSFQATRGGVVSVSPPTLGQLAGQNPNSVGVWTVDDDEEATDGDPAKSCARIVCGSPRETEIYAITKCLIIGNFVDRTFSEYVGAWSELAMVHQDRFAEQRLFNQIVNSSITANVSLATTTLSATRDLLNHLDLAAWNMRTRHRTLRDYPFRVILPDIALGVMRTDIARSMPGGSFVENMAVAEQVIQRFFAERSLNVTWSPDLVVQNAPADSQPLAGWPSQIPYAIYPEGTFLHLDAGELDLGVVRDSELNSTNDFEVFAETFEAVHPFGVEAIAGNVEVCPSGAVSGTEDLSSICGTGS